METEPPRGLSEEVWRCQTAVFSLLERARLTSDFQLAALAQKRLLELGVAVLFEPRGQGGQGEATSIERRSRVVGEQPGRPTGGPGHAAPRADGGRP